MLKILKAEYRKFFSGKLFITILILAIIFPLLSAGLYGLVVRGIDPEQFQINAEVAFIGSFSPLNNFGFLLLIFMLVILLADFSQNTIRNKVVAGYSKSTIYLAGAIFTLSIAFVATTVYVFLNYLLTGLVINFGSGDFLVVFKHWAVGMLATLAIYAFLQFVAYTFKTLGASLGVVIGSLIGSLLIYTIISFRLSESANRILTIFVPLLQIIGSLFGSKDYFWMLLIDGVYVVLLVGFGAFLSKKLDYK